VTNPRARVGISLAEAETPSLLVDIDALDRNVARMARFAADHDVKLRPHAKTHRSPIIARRQIAAGAVGVCCQTVGEAEVMAQGGVGDILISNEIWGANKLARVAALARQAKVAICADDARNVADLDRAANDFGVRIDVLVDINVVGDVRTGVHPGEPAVRLAERVAESKWLSFAGLQAYAGKAQHVRDPDERAAAVRTAHEAVAKTRQLLGTAGLDCPWITGSGTGTYMLDGATDLYTELQAGSYVFMDLDYRRNLEADGKFYNDFEQALFVYSTVMSRPSESAAVLDAGLKSFSFDSGPPALDGVPEARWLGGGDEHLRLEVPGRPFPHALGAKVKLVPGHCDPTVNLYDCYLAVRDDRIEAIWPVAARGASS